MPSGTQGIGECLYRRKERVENMARVRQGSSKEVPICRFTQLLCNKSNSVSQNHVTWIVNGDANYICIC